MKSDIELFSERLAVLLEKRINQVSQFASDKPEDHALYRSMIIIYSELSEMIKSATPSP